MFTRVLKKNNAVEIFKNIRRFVKMETIKLEETTTDLIQEGKAEVMIVGGNVFYNPVQEFNRDLSIAVLNMEVNRYNKALETKSKDYKDSREGFSILEALSASGLRSIRYAKEIPGVKNVIANDVSEKAVATIEANAKNNGVDHVVKTSCSDAVAVMIENRIRGNRFHAVDLDPYGCPSPFLDSAVQSVSIGGLLMVTCTDMAVLCGNSPETCYTKYGAVSLKNIACHEIALRIVLQCIESHANRYKRYIVPLLSVSADFYVRVFVRIFEGAAKCKETTSKLSMVYQCNGCHNVSFQKLGVVSLKGEEGKERKSYSLSNGPPVDKHCVHCGGKHQIGGPIWTNPIHDVQYVTELLQLVDQLELGTKKRILGTLSVIREELSDVPLYYTSDKLCSIVHSSTIPIMAIRSALLNGKYRVSFSHASRSSIKTDAPMSFLLDILRQWVKANPINTEKMIPGSPSYKILNTPIENEIDFSLRPDANPLSREMGLLRYPANPAPFWGPGTRSKSNTLKPPKSEKNQNKKKRKQEEKNGENLENPTKILKETEEVAAN